MIAVQLTRQLAMRLQYAKLKVDHGWVGGVAHLLHGNLTDTRTCLRRRLPQTRQNLNEVENLYFHRHRATRPPVPQTITRRAGLPTQKPKNFVSHEAVDHQNAAPSSKLKIGSDPTVYSIDPSGTAPVPPTPKAQPPLSETSAPNVSSSNSGPIRTLPVPLTAAAPPPTKRSAGTSSTSTPTPTLHQTASMSSIQVSTPTTASLPYGGTSKSGSIRTPKSTAKARAASVAAPSSPSRTFAAPRVTIVHNKHTSTPSTLAPPMLSLDSHAARLAASGTSTLTTTGGGPTSYESFWSSLSSTKGSAGGQVGLGLRASTLSGLVPIAPSPSAPAPTTIAALTKPAVVPASSQSNESIPTPGLKALTRTGTSSSAGGSFTSLSGTTPYPTVVDPKLYQALRNQSAPYPASRAMPS